MLGLLPLMLGHQETQVGVEQKFPSASAQKLADEHAGVSDDDHFGSTRRRSSRPASSSSPMPVSFSTRSTVSPS